MTLPSFCYCSAGACSRYQAIRGARSYRSISAARARAEQQTSRTLLLLPVDERDTRTDGRAPDLCIVLCYSA